MRKLAYFTVLFLFVCQKKAWKFSPDDCGRRVNHRRSKQTRVVGGHISSRDQHPWYVSIFKDGEIHCGGSILGSHWVLTAAHCIDRHAKMFVIVAKNEDDLRRTGRGIYHLVVAAVPHDSYHKGYSEAADIALLFVSPSIKFTFRYPETRGESVLPICLPEPGAKIISNYASIAGNGMIAEDGLYSPVLLSTEVQILNTEYCSRVYGRYLFHSESMICAGTLTGGKDACQGDSGGALEVQVENKVYQIGIISTGIGCGRAYFPGVYTNIAYYRSWILATAGI